MKKKAEAPPKTSQAADEAAKQEDAPKDEAPVEEAAGNGHAKDEAPEEPEPVAETATANTDKPTNKRKKATDPDEPQKAARRSGRGAPKAQPTQQQLLSYLLAKDAEELCLPDDEQAAIKEDGNLRTYSSGFLTPFEELLCAVILSRPISHRLGLRTIRTILNAPYNFTSAKAVQAAGSEKHHQALENAKTQHKAKTAEEIGQIADVVLAKFTAPDDKEGTDLLKVRDDCDRDVPRERKYLQDNIKGLGKTGLDIFFRRVQWLWTVGYPFVDDRTAQALHKLGLPDDGEELAKAIDEHWGKLDTKHISGVDDDVKKKRAFVLILERATGADLESKSEELVAAAATS